MSRRAVIGILIALFGVALAIFGIFVITNLLQRNLAPTLPVATQPLAVTQKVVVVRRDLAAGSLLKPADLALVEVPVELAPANVFTDVNAAAGKMTKVLLVSGEMVMPHHLADPTNVIHDQAYILGDDQVLMAFPADDLLSRINMLQRGDQVDILASIEEPVRESDALTVVGGEEEEQEQTELFTFDAMQRVTVQAFVVEIVGGSTVSSEDARDIVSGANPTPQPTPTPAPSQIQPTAVLLALNPQDALVLKHLKDAGATFDIVLRAPNSNTTFDLKPVMPEYLIDRFGLTVAR